MKFLLDTDTCISALKGTPLSRKLNLVSNNEREFGRVPGLRLENWAK